MIDYLYRSSINIVHWPDPLSLSINLRVITSSLAPYFVENINFGGV